MHKQAIKVIITGGPGSGKTTLINSIKDKSYHCVDEAARQVIAEQLALHSQKLPWLDLLGFSDLVYRRIELLVKESDPFPLSFHDRSVVDVLAYLKNGAIPIPPYMLANASELGYFHRVFFAPHWPAIYSTDNLRLENEQQALAISKLIRETYTELGFQVIDLPFVNVEERTAFVLNNLHEEIT